MTLEMLQGNSGANQALETINLTRFHQRSMMTKIWVPYFAIWSAQSISTIKLTFGWDCSFSLFGDVNDN